MDLNDAFDESLGALRGVRERVALVMMFDNDGDIALTRVIDHGDGKKPSVKLLGWMLDQECAMEFEDMVNKIGSGELSLSFGSDEEIERAFRDGISQ